ncbi:hypothetical protein BKA66DRAFT_537762, partial [Pyrenochaeta sp. MPI-SDFR-AT-0127]
MALSSHKLPAVVAVELNTDVWLSVLDYIRMPSDLKSLCLTSKALRDLATPCLYSDVFVQVWHEEYHERFFRSIAAGGHAHLVHTRTLTIEDKPPLAESNSIVTSPLELGFCDGTPTPAVTKDNTISLIIPMFPHNKLRAFRFISSRQLSLEIYLRITKHQANIEHMMCPLDSDVRFSSPDIVFFHALRSLDLPLLSPEALRHLVPMVIVMGKSLESLSLGYFPATRLPESSPGVFASVLEDLEKDSEVLLPRLKELHLKNFYLKNNLDSLLKILRFDTLKRLSLFHCSGAEHFFADLAPHVKGSVTALEHLAIIYSESQFHVPYESILARECFCNLLQSE